ncbi:hypothetical protein A5M85_09285 [Cellulophaga lytica]|uniref:hypothetical protein n=1 Tax=Cellulophaga lytica TaxID=979 RepID=UPI0009508168|nr:hypothetical protein [Cellulophaga lytica]APU10468.1 hypothetical protein A5M85_09285 [Cellulophaga lytica]
MKYEKMDILWQENASRLGNEIGWMSKLIKNGKDVLNKLTNPKHKNSMFGLSDQAVVSSQKMQIVYLVNLFKYFMQDYISIKDELPETKVNQNRF